MKYFSSKTEINEIKFFFEKEKKPFVIRSAHKSSIDLGYLKKYFGKEVVTSLNPSSNREDILLSKLIKSLDKGLKYRLRANTKIGNKIVTHLDTKIIDSIKNKKKNPFDYLLSYGKSSRQHTLFLSSKDCTFAKHSHVTSGLIMNLFGKKKWFISKSRESFWTIKYKNISFPNPLYITDKNIKIEEEVELEPGDILYMPAYWFHYTFSEDISISYNYFFTESISYYLKKSFLMLMFQAFTNPFYSLIRGLQQEPEKHIFHKQDFINRCNKIKNKIKRVEALQYFKESDYS